MMFSSSKVRGRGLAGSGESVGAATWQPAELGELDDLQGPGADAAPVPEAEPVSDPEEQARVEAEQAAAELQAEIDAAYQRGYEDGRAEGRAVEATKVGHAVRSMEDVARRFEQEMPGWHAALEQNLVALAAALAREVIGRELKGSVEDINGLVQRAISEFPLEAAVRVRLNPADLTAISSPMGGSAVESGRQVRWLPDPDIAPGGCMVEGPESIVDGRVEKALERIYAKLIYD